VRVGGGVERSCARIIGADIKEMDDPPGRAAAI
jgi:hypothetical protein